MALEKTNLLRLWENTFRMGSRDLLIEIMKEKPREEQVKAFEARTLSDYESKWREFLLQGQIYISKLLKAENLSILIGAGPSIPLGAITIRNIPLRLEFQIAQGLPENSQEIILFYDIMEYYRKEKPFSQINIKDRIKNIKTTLEGKDELKVKEQEVRIPLEDYLSYLYCLKSTLISTSKAGEASDNLLILKNGKREVNVKQDILENLIDEIKKQYFYLLKGVPEPTLEKPLAIHKQFLKKILTRPLNLRRPKVFTTNNDLIIENAMDELGIMYLDGFIGTAMRAFRPESYNYDFYFPSTTTEGKVHRVDQVIHYYKIHGSINWVRSYDHPGNIYGIETRHVETIEKEGKYGDVMIYPTPLKTEHTLDFPYSDLFRRFADAITQPQSVLITLGYSFGDEHVNRIIYQALTVPSFTLLIVDPAGYKNAEIKRLMDLEDSRIYILSGPQLGTFEQFTKLLLPDIKELEVREKSVQSARQMLGIKEKDGEIPRLEDSEEL